MNVRLLRRRSLRKYGRGDHPGVVGLTVEAFVANNVKEGFGGIIAVIAQDPHLSMPVILRHHSSFNLLIKLSPKP